MLLLNPQTENAKRGHELGSCGVTTGVPGTGLRGRPARDSLTLSLSLHVRSLCMCQAGGETAVSLGPQEEPPNKTWYWALQSPHAGFDHGRAGREVAPTARSERRTDPSKHSLRRCTQPSPKRVRLAVCLGAAATASSATAAKAAVAVLCLDYAAVLLGLQAAHAAVLWWASRTALVRPVWRRLLTGAWLLSLCLVNTEVTSRHEG